MILGIDPGIATCGYGIIGGPPDNRSIVLSGTWKTKKDNDVSIYEDGYWRAFGLSQNLAELVASNHGISLIAIETFVGRSGAAMNVVNTCVTIGWLMSTAHHSLGKAVTLLVPNQWKGALGIKSSKDMTPKQKKDISIEFLKKNYSYECKTNHEADAICIALAGGKHV